MPQAGSVTSQEEQEWVSPVLAVTGCVWVLILQMGRQQGRRGKSRGCLSCGLTWGSCISCGMDGTKPYVSSPSSPKAQKCPLGATQDLGGSRGMLENELCCITAAV